MNKRKVASNLAPLSAMIISPRRRAQLRRATWKYESTHKQERKKQRERRREKIAEQVRRWSLAHPEMNRQRSRRWRAAHSKKVSEYTKKYLQDRPEIARARILSMGIRIPKGQICEICGKHPARNKHHPNYHKPYEVIFVDVRCHKLIHLGTMGVNDDILTRMQGRACDYQKVHRRYRKKESNNDLYCDY